MADKSRYDAFGCTTQRAVTIAAVATLCESDLVGELRRLRALVAAIERGDARALTVNGRGRVPCEACNAHGEVGDDAESLRLCAICFGEGDLDVSRVVDDEQSREAARAAAVSRIAECETRLIEIMRGVRPAETPAEVSL